MKKMERVVEHKPNEANGMCFSLSGKYCVISCVNTSMFFFIFFVSRFLGACDIANIHINQ